MIRKRLRIYFDQALFKSPLSKETFWHQDQYFWPLDTTNVIGSWIPLQDCTEDMGIIKFIKGSHLFGDLKGNGLSSKSQTFFDDVIKQKNLRISKIKKINAGDMTFHYGWTIHGALPNKSNKMREAFIISYYEDGTKISKLDNPSKINDSKLYLGGKKFGEIANHSINKIVYNKI